MEEYLCRPFSKMAFGNRCFKSKEISLIEDYLEFADEMC